ncbi:MAG: hypothetical protein LBE08_04405 [Bifidobacteriaceae bacterium]|nr:hypothetical protein [Bifidobacteriaceae bacterium]
MRSLEPILKSNDLRGAVPGQWGPEEAQALGWAVAQAFRDAKALAVGHDMRVSGPALAEALTAGALQAGLDVVQLGRISTDTMYYASGALGLPGAMLTASHNPAGDNGLKLMRPGAKPVSRETGLREVVRAAERYGNGEGRGTASGEGTAASANAGMHDAASASTGIHDAAASVAAAAHDAASSADDAAHGAGVSVGAAAAHDAASSAGAADGAAASVGAAADGAAWCADDAADGAGASVGAAADGAAQRTGVGVFDAAGGAGAAANAAANGAVGGAASVGAGGVVGSAAAGARAERRRTGAVSGMDVLPDFARFLRRAVDLTGIRPLRVAIDAGNGMGGVVADAALGDGVGLGELPVELVRLYFEPDGTFPNHPANPLEPANLADLQRAVVESRADLGVAFDGDADRCFVVDERGEPVAASVIGVLIALREVERERAAGRDPVVVRNAITSQVLPELLEAAGARTVRTRVGHGIIKPAMAELDAVFGAEHSGHFYFRDFFYADSGILTAMHVLAALGSQGLPLSELAEIYTPYAASGELNFRVADPVASIQKVQLAYADDAAQGTVMLDSLDGLTVNHWSNPPRWWANVRPSNTEALLRLNVEAEDRDVMIKVRDGIAGLVGEALSGEGPGIR